MLFNLNEFLISMSFALDFVEMDILGVTSNHGKRTAYISLRIAKELGLSSEELYDIVSINVPILRIADVVEVNFPLWNNDPGMQSQVLKYISELQGKMFSSGVVTIFKSIAKAEDFWLNLMGDNIDNALKNATPQHSMDLSFEEIRKITGVFSKIIDCKSQYTQRHSYYTRLALSEIKGFEDITEWTSNHHEKLNGQGYPQV